IDRARRQSGPMFDPSKTLLLRGRDQFAVDKQARCRIAVISVEADNFHSKFPNAEKFKCRNLIIRVPDVVRLTIATKIGISSLFATAATFRDNEKLETVA